MRALLDTHTLLWWMAGDERIGAAAAALISEESHHIFVSAASVWEIATKVRLGKLPGAAELIDELGPHLTAQRFDALDVTHAHARRAGLLPGPHRDPFDRMLIAQALEEDMLLLSNEAIFDGYGVRRLW